MHPRLRFALGASLTLVLLLASACDETTAPADSYIRAEITGAIQDTFVSGIRFAGSFSGSDFRTLDIRGSDYRESGNVKTLNLRSLARVALPDGQGVSFLDIGPESREVTGLIATYHQDSLWYGARRGVIRTTRTGDVITASFSFRMFHYCTYHGGDACVLPREPPEDTDWIEVEGHLRGDPFP